MSLQLLRITSITRYKRINIFIKGCLVNHLLVWLRECFDKRNNNFNVGEVSKKGGKGLTSN